MVNSESRQLRGSLAGLRKICSDKTATSLKSNGLVAFPVRGMWLAARESTRRYLVDHGYTLPEFLPAGAAEPEVEEGDLKENERISLYGPTSTDMVFLKDAIPQTSWTKTRKVRIKLLGETISSYSKPLK